MGDKYFDINCMYGKWPYSKLHYETAEGLSAAMQGAGIYKAVSARIEAYRYHHSENSSLIKDLAGYGDILPCFILTPHVPGEEGFRDIDEKVADISKKGVGFVRLYPVTNGFSLEEWCCGSLYSALEKHNIALLLHFKELARESSANEIADKIFRICSNHPKLQIIILTFRHNNNRLIYRLMEACSNLFFDISFFGVYRQLEDIVKRYGSSHLLFGTNMPFFEPGRVICLLKYADVSDADKEAIAYGNAENLLSRSVEMSGTMPEVE